MKKRNMLLSALLGACGVLCAFGLVSCDGGTQGLQYTLSDDGSCYSVSGYYGTDEDVVIPASYKGLPVTSVGYRAFYSNEYLRSVTFPESIQTVKAEAFASCKSLKDVAFNEGLLRVGGKAFMHCDALKELVFPDSLTEIGSTAFGWCDGLKSVVVSKNVTKIESEAFLSCTGLESVNLPQDGKLTILGWGAFYGCRSLKNIDIPETVIELDGRVFSSCGIESIEIPDVLQLKTIYKEMFSHCVNLRSFTIPDTVTKIEEGAFENCDSLEEIVIPASVKTIDSVAFRGCRELKTITIAEHSQLQEIGFSVFEDCKSLTGVYVEDIDKWCEIEFTDVDANPLYYADTLYAGGQAVTELTFDTGVTELKTYAFANYQGLTSVKIGGESVVTVGESAFVNCQGLTSVELLGESVVTVGKSAFADCGNLQSFTVSESARVDTIGSNAFKGCTGLTEFVFPDGLTTVGRHAFEGCQGLTDLILPDSLQDISDAFPEFKNRVFYMGTPEQWEQVKKSGNGFMYSWVYYYSETEYKEPGVIFWHYVDGVPTLWPYDNLLP